MDLVFRGTEPQQNMSAIKASFWGVSSMFDLVEVQQVGMFPQIKRDYFSCKCNDIIGNWKDTCFNTYGFSSR